MSQPNGSWCHGDAPRPPAAVRWAVVFNAFHGAILAVLLLPALISFLSTADREAQLGALVLLLAAAGALVGLMLLTFSLRRCGLFAWVIQLLLLCLLIGLVPLYGVVWIPLVVAWCGQPTRDWFDPPLRREFGDPPPPPMLRW